MQSKRVTRFRIDDSSAANSVNPSPKKQPRLNLPSAKETQWNNNNRNQAADDGSLRKRSKVEETDTNSDDKQSLSDIQFIDSITPEHTITASNTIYACAQIHNPPSSKRSSILEETPIETQLRKLSATDKNENKESRFSYPGIGAKFTDDKKLLSRFSLIADNSLLGSERNQKYRQSFSDTRNFIRNERKSVEITLNSSPSDQLIKKNENDFSKVSLATPSSPSKSPHYSLLVGETSSENSSSLNTPVFDMDMSSATQQFDQRMDELKNMSRNSDSKDLTPLISTGDNKHQVIYF